MLVQATLLMSRRVRARRAATLDKYSWIETQSRQATTAIRRVSIPRFENGMRCWNVDDEPLERWKRRGAGGRVAAEKAVEPEKDKNEVEVEQGWTRVVRKGRKGLCTSAGVIVATNKCVTGVIPQNGDISTAITNHAGRITRAG